MFGYCDNQRDLCFNGFLDGFARMRSSHVNCSSIRLQMLLRLSDSRKDGQAKMFSTASWLHTTNDVGAILERLLSILCCDLSSESLI